MKIFSVEEMQSVLKMPAVVDAHRVMEVELAEGRAVNRLRSDIYCGSPDGGVYVLKSMDGVVPAMEVGAVRINSDIISWIPRAGGIRKEKVPTAPGNRWVGLILLFSTRTGEPLAIMPDSYIQRMRVGATSGLAVEYMARKDAKVLAILGTGWQAGAQLLAACAVHEFEELRAYSPNPEHREAFRKEMREELGRDIRMMESADDLVNGADVLMSATNSIDPVVRADWIKPGMHFSCIRNAEFQAEVYGLPMRVVVHTHAAVPEDIVTVGTPDVRELHDNKSWYEAHKAINWLDRPTLAEVMTGRAVGRAADDEITCFFNLIGLGTQFAATAATLLELTKGMDIGHDIPTEWFTQTVHP
jgi:alanine dehydrogenase